MLDSFFFMLKIILHWPLSCCIGSSYCFHALLIKKEPTGSCDDHQSWQGGGSGTYMMDFCANMLRVSAAYLWKCTVRHTKPSRTVLFGVSVSNPTLCRVETHLLCSHFLCVTQVLAYDIIQGTRCSAWALRTVWGLSGTICSRPRRVCSHGTSWEWDAHALYQSQPSEDELWKATLTLWVQSIHAVTS